MKLCILFCVLFIFKYSFPVYMFFRSCLYQSVYRYNIVNNAAVIFSNPLHSLKFFVLILDSELLYTKKVLNVMLKGKCTKGRLKIKMERAGYLRCRAKGQKEEL